MTGIISIAGVTKTYDSGLTALHGIDLEIRRGEIFALLGPNGAGKTTLIGVICGLVKPSTGAIVADGHDIIRDWRAARSKIGLVPQELTTDAFETVWASPPPASTSSCAATCGRWCAACGRAASPSA